MKYISLFSGIEAATVAWDPLGWEPVAFCEIDDFPSAVLAQRFPNVPNLGDITKVDWSEYRGEVDVVVGGSPCQSFSIAGNREGLKGESGLMVEYIRAVREILPRYFVWENVPGALSCEKGAAFGQLLSEMDDLGYGLAWRVLDAQFFGVAQRRRRVFLVGCLGDPGRAAEILFEPKSLRWDSPSSREKRKELAAGAERGVGSSGGNCLTPWDCQSKRIYSPDGVFPTLYAAENGSHGDGINEDVAFTFNTADRHAVVAPKNVEKAYAFSADQSAKAGSLGFNEEQSPTLRGGCSGTNQVPTVMHAAAYTLKIRSGCEGGGKGPLIQQDVSATLATNQDQTLFQPIGSLCLNDQGGSVMAVSDEIAPTLRSQTHGHEQIVIDRAAFNQGVNAKYDPHIEQAEVMDTLVARGPHALMCMASCQANAEIEKDMAPAQAARQYKDPQIVTNGYVVRKLTPTECERLQGFQDGWTKVPYRGKSAEDCPDGPRYKALGNSMAVPVMRWIGERIELVEN